MEQAIKKIHQDDREISAIYWDDEDDNLIKVGEYGYEKIVAYPEEGDYCLKSHLAIYVDGQIKQRLSATVVRIVYK